MVARRARRAFETFFSLAQNVTADLFQATIENVTACDTDRIGWSRDPFSHFWWLLHFEFPPRESRPEGWEFRPISVVELSRRSCSRQIPLPPSLNRIR